MWAVVSAGYPALLSSSYFERINDDDDDDDDDDDVFVLSACVRRRISTISISARVNPGGGILSLTGLQSTSSYF